MNYSSKNGFSLIEIVIAVAVVVILAGVVTPSVIRQIDQSNIDSVVEDFRNLEQAIEKYHADIGTVMPLNDIGGFTLAEADPTHRHFVSGDGQARWNGPYLTQIPLQSSFGGFFDIDAISPKEATIDLGTQAQLGINYAAALQAINAALDGDNDLSRGSVWGDSNGIHYGYNYVRP